MLTNNPDYVGKKRNKWISPHAPRDVWKEYALSYSDPLSHLFSKSPLSQIIWGFGVS